MHTYPVSRMDTGMVRGRELSVLTFHDRGCSLYISPYLYLAAYLTRPTKR